ncbi:MAG: hypothetical protein LBT09_05740, partial [Planctomycetaceae bacterium]|nr:hypothetical protein [Planctomycetaceae bacterium]
NRLTKVQTPTESIDYIYDYQNRLVKRTDNQNVTTFIHDDWQIIATLDSKNNVKDRYLWGTKQDELICNNNNWTLGDHLNTIRDTIKSNGTVVSHLEYNAFGKLISETKNDLPFFAYTGKLFDNISDQQWNINRWYDSNVGRWMSDDPIGYDANDSNLFRFVRNHTVSSTDPFGYESLTITTYYARLHVPYGDGQGIIEFADYHYFYDITVEFTRQCEKIYNASIKIISIKGNMRDTLDKYGFSVVVIGATVSYYNKTRISKSVSEECPPLQKGTRLKHTLIIDVYERAAIGLNPGFGPITFDLGVSFGVETKMGTAEFIIKQDCCRKCQ